MYCEEGPFMTFTLLVLSVQKCPKDRGRLAFASDSGHCFVFFVE